jgi:hypothetical protein
VIRTAVAEASQPVRFHWTETRKVPATDIASVATESWMVVRRCGGPEEGRVMGNSWWPIGTRP